MPRDERFPYVAFNSWGYGDRIDDASMRRCFEVCHKLGIELFVVDFGWEDPDWHPRQDLFPHGLAPLADAAHEAGMLFGIHLSFGNVSNLSRMYQGHPEWANGAGQWAYLTEGEVYRLTLGNPETRDWIADKLVEIIDETKVDHFLTDHFLWGPTDPDVQDRHATDDYLTTAEGFDLVMERVHVARPNVLLEHCDNGIGLPTYKMVAQHMTSIGPDAQGSQYERVGTWRISRVLPPRYLDHYVTERLAPGIPFDAPFGDYEYRSHIFGGPMILMTDIMALEEDGSDWNALVRAIDLVKRIRRRVIEGKVLHLLEPQPVERAGNGGDGWDTIGSYHEQTDTAVILAFRLGGDLEERTIPVHGINPDSTYRITYEDRSDMEERSGSDIISNGILLTLPGPGQQRIVDGIGLVRASEVIHLSPIA
jgi:alpha-galactosidase